MDPTVEQHAVRKPDRRLAAGDHVGRLRHEAVEELAGAVGHDGRDGLAACRGAHGSRHVRVLGNERVQSAAAACDRAHDVPPASARDCGLDADVADDWAGEDEQWVQAQPLACLRADGLGREEPTREARAHSLGVPRDLLYEGHVVRA